MSAAAVAMRHQHQRELPQADLDAGASITICGTAPGLCHHALAAIARAASTPRPINPAVTVAMPENVQDYEVGREVRLELLGMPVRTNLDGYHTGLSRHPDAADAAQCHPGHRDRAAATCTQAAFNAGNAWASPTTTSPSTPRRRRSMAWNGTSPLLPTDGLTLNASGSYLDARYTDFTFTPPPGYLLPSRHHQPVGHALPVAGLADQRDRDLCLRASRKSPACRWTICPSRRIITGRAAIWRTCGLQSQPAHLRLWLAESQAGFHRYRGTRTSTWRCS